MTFQAIVDDFQKYITQNGGIYSEWYVGITGEPDRRLFTEHNVINQGGIWIHSPGDTNDIARSVEEYFLKLGCDGGSGGGDYTSKIVYAYKKDRNTVERNNRR